mmetsp:Transcript_51212/g.148718  ORF Transcript_51212/g.148718 Transcript_51212/m.148718 type:complete len:225 (-) Transcript_51212:532-1206(-)
MRWKALQAGRPLQRAARGRGADGGLLVVGRAGDLGAAPLPGQGRHGPGSRPPERGHAHLHCRGLTTRVAGDAGHHERRRHPAGRHGRGLRGGLRLPGRPRPRVLPLAAARVLRRGERRGAPGRRRGAARAVRGEAAELGGAEPGARVAGDTSNPPDAVGKLAAAGAAGARGPRADGLAAAERRQRGALLRAEHPAGRGRGRGGPPRRGRARRAALRHRSCRLHH